MLTETWLTSKINSSELFDSTKRFNVYRRDRGDRCGGGVLVAVADHISSSFVPVVTNLEIIFVEICTCYKKIILGICYRPPSCDPSFVNSLHDVVNIVMERFPNVPVLLAGDFNYPNIFWSSDVPQLSPFSTDSYNFLSFCSDFNFTQIVTQPTRITPTTSSVLDLVLTNVPDLFMSPLCLPQLSDHSLLHFTMDVCVPHHENYTKHIRDYAAADFDAINRELCLFLDSYLDEFEARSVNSNWILFKEKVAYLTETFVPLRLVTTNKHAPWYSQSLKRLANKKKRLFRSAKVSNSQARWDSYYVANGEYRRATKAAKETYFNNTLPNMLVNNPRQFWRVVNKKDTREITLKTSDGVTHKDDCAVILCDTFAAAVSGLLNKGSNPVCQASGYLPMEAIRFDTAGVQKIIENLKVSSSAGIDNITSKFLINTKVYSAIILTKIFEQSLEAGCLPDDWSVGRIIPFFKSGDKLCPENYRPVSITSIPCKIMEHVIYSQLVKFLEGNSFFTDSQHGFRKNFSCETQLICFIHDLHSILDNGTPIDCIFLDFSKAFDKVPHDLLILKLRSLNIDDNVLAWVIAFLSNRSQFVTVNNFDSPRVPVGSGVPQGSVLGPLLFLVYINDLPLNITSSVSLFADDCVIYRAIKGHSDVLELQADMDRVQEWCETWGMALNVNKCKYMHVNRHSTSIRSYHINNVLLEVVNSYKYLGIHITSTLSWKTHIEYIAGKANSTLGYLRRNFNQAPVSLKLLLYKVLVRSRLEYAASVWDPGHDSLIYELERVQNRAARFILSNYHRTSSVTSMKTTLALPLLSLRRKVSRLCIFHKIYFTNPLLRSRLLAQPTYVSTRIDHRHKVGLPLAHTKCFHNSFVPKTSVCWNHLPCDIVGIKDAALFKIAVTNFICT